MKIEKFEDMKVWNDAREFCKSIYLLSNNANFKKDYGSKIKFRGLLFLF